jgi:hypothetical protein
VQDSLLLEVVDSLSAPLVKYPSTPVAGFTAQCSSEAALGQVSVCHVSQKSEQVGLAPPSFSSSLHVVEDEKSVSSSSTMVIKDDWVKGDTLPLGGCPSGSIIAKMGEDLSLNGLIQSQKGPVGFGLSGEIVVWDQGGE